LSQLAHPATTAEVEPLLDLGKARHADAAATLYTLYRRRIHEYCRGQLHERQDADDALQSTFLYACVLLERGVTPLRPLPWLYTIAHNVCRTRRRALRHRARVEGSFDLDTLDETIGSSDPSHEDLDGLANALTQLPATQREALLLREWQGLSYAEIATRLCITQSAVETLLFRARRNVARNLQRTTTRLGSLLNGAFLIRGMRRLLAIAPAKTAAATVALVIAAGAAVAPFLGTTPRVQRTIPTRQAPEPRVVHPALVAATKPVSRTRVQPSRPRRSGGAVERTPPAPPPQADVQTSETPPAPRATIVRTAPAGTNAQAVPPVQAAIPDGVVTTAQNAVTDVQEAASDVVGPPDVSTVANVVASAVPGGSTPVVQP
jgi:RNA polymerase sigma factor (sigma-70 family)